MGDRFIAYVRSRLEQVFQDKEMHCGEFDEEEKSEEKYGPIWPLFAWILSTAVVTVLISLLFDAADRATVQLVCCVVVGAILLVPFRMLAGRLFKRKL